MTTLRAGAATDVGLVRANNEDSLLVASPLFAVADGMGGHAAGEVAAATAIRVLEETFQAARTRAPEALLEAARAANRAVWQEAQQDQQLWGMGTTLVAIALVEVEGSDRLAVVNVGDSRVYLQRDGELRQLTEDHSLVAELVAGGQLSRQEAEVHPQRNVVTRAIGVDPEVEVDLQVLEPRSGDRYLLCSDGLSDAVPDEQVSAVLRRLADPGEAARELVEQAKQRGGTDNITVVIVDVEDAGERGKGVAVAEEAPAPGDSPPTEPLEAPRSQESSRLRRRWLPGWLPGRRAPGEAPEPEPEPTPADTGEPSVAGPDSAGDDGAEPAVRTESSVGRPLRPKARLVTARVIGFFALLLLVLGGAAAAIAWYARSSYFVGLEGDRLTIFQGRPGGVLWFEPTVAKRTGVTTSEVLPARLADLRAGEEEPSMQAALQYVRRLRAEDEAARSADRPALQPSSPSPATSSTPATTAKAG